MNKGSASRVFSIHKLYAFKDKFNHHFINNNTLQILDSVLLHMFSLK
jgi:hypothetical protein